MSMFSRIIKRKKPVQTEDNLMNYNDYYLTQSFSKMSVIELFWWRVDQLEKQIEKTTDILWKAMWKDKLIELMKNVPDKKMVN